MSLYLLSSILVIWLLAATHCQEIVNVSDIVKTDYGQIELIPNDHNKDIVEFLWKVNDFWQLLETGQEMVFSTRFYITKPGYRLQMMLIPNTTYSDNQAYLGTFFRLVTGIYDTEVEWPYKLKTVLTIVQHSRQNNRSHGRSDYLKPAEGQAFQVVPNTDACRLRSAFLRPSADQDFNPNPDGCGNRRHLAINILDENREKYFKNNSVWIKITVFLTDFGTGHKKAQMSMKYNQLVSYYEWTVNDYMRLQNQTLASDKISVLTSDPFYTHTNGYLMQMFLTLLPKRKAFALSLAMAQGDFDRYLQWPFPYKFEVSIIDQSPSYWKRDYAIQMHPSTSECGSDPFFSPSNYPDFCFVTVQSLELLTLTHYNFIFNNTMKIGFMTKFGSFNNRKQAALVSDEKGLATEFSWLIPSFSGKLEKFDLGTNSPKLLASEEFYTNGQGYLCQIILTVNKTEANDFELGVELSLIEGEFDAVLDWPFNKSYDLSITRISGGNNGLIEESSDTRNGTLFTTTVVPALSGCTRQSFQKPIERNPPCGQRSGISINKIARVQDVLKMGNLLVKARVRL